MAQHGLQAGVGDELKSFERAVERGIEPAQQEQRIVRRGKADPCGAARGAGGDETQRRGGDDADRALGAAE